MRSTLDKLQMHRMTEEEIQAKEAEAEAKAKAEADELRRAFDDFVEA